MGDTPSTSPTTPADSGGPDLAILLPSVIGGLICLAVLALVVVLVMRASRRKNSALAQGAAPAPGSVPAPGVGAGGVAGQGQILAVNVGTQPVSAGPGAVQRAVTLTVRVVVPGWPEYTATVEQLVPESSLPALQSGAWVWVLVDPTNANRVQVNVGPPAGTGPA